MREQIPSEIERLQIENERLKKENEALRRELEILKVGKDLESSDSPAVIEKIAKILEIYNKEEYLPKTYEDQKRSFGSTFGKEIRRVECMNSMERRRSMGPYQTMVPPDFKESSSGDFFCIELPDKSFASVPRLQMTYQESSHSSRAFGEVFSISPQGDEYENNKRYYVKEVVKPAIFKKDAQGKFNLVEQGEIVLREI